MDKGFRWMAAAALAVAAAGCCNNPGVFGKLERSLRLAQAYYEPLLQEDLKRDDVRRAVVAADTTLLLAGELQAMWCPSEQAGEQLELQCRELTRLAEAARVKK